MSGATTARVGTPLALLTGALLLIALLPASAFAAWSDVQASIVDPLGTGVVPLLNVEVVNHATSDASPVTTVQFSDDGQSWYAAAYTGQPADWVLGGVSGHKVLLVRFGSADGGVSPVVTASIDVDTFGPVTIARSARQTSRGRAILHFSVRDTGSKVVDATLVVKGKGQTRRIDLGRVHTGRGHALVRLPKGSYTWRVQATDLAGRAQVKQTTARLVIR